MPSNRPGLLGIAIALAAGLHANNPREAHMQMQQAQALRFQLDNAYKMAGAHKRSNAAQQRRAAKKRRNIRARASKRRA